MDNQNPYGGMQGFLSQQRRNSNGMPSQLQNSNLDSIFGEGAAADLNNMLYGASTNAGLLDNDFKTSTLFQPDTADGLL